MAMEKGRAAVRNPHSFMEPQAHSDFNLVAELSGGGRGHLLQSMRFFVAFLLAFSFMLVCYLEGADDKQVDMFEEYEVVNYSARENLTDWTFAKQQVLRLQVNGTNNDDAMKGTTGDTRVEETLEQLIAVLDRLEMQLDSRELMDSDGDEKGLGGPRTEGLLSVSGFSRNRDTRMHSRSWLSNASGKDLGRREEPDMDDDETRTRPGAGGYGRRILVDLNPRGTLTQTRVLPLQQVPEGVGNLSRRTLVDPNPKGTRTPTRVPSEQAEQPEVGDVGFRPLVDLNPRVAPRKSPEVHHRTNQKPVSANANAQDEVSTSPLTSNQLRNPKPVLSQRENPVTPSNPISRYMQDKVRSGTMSKTVAVFAGNWTGLPRVEIKIGGYEHLAKSVGLFRRLQDRNMHRKESDVSSRTRRRLEAKKAARRRVSKSTALRKLTKWVCGTLMVILLILMNPGFHRGGAGPNPRQHSHIGDAGPPYVGTATLKVPPCWSIERNHVYTLRAWVSDLILWASATDLDQHRQGPIAALQVTGSARELIREIPPDQLAQGMIDPQTGNHVSGLMILVRTLARRYSPLEGEASTRAISDFLNFSRMPHESVDAFLVRFDVLRN